MKKTQSILAGFAALLTIILTSAVGYLAFVFPKTVAVWKDEGRALSALEKLTVDASRICTSLGRVFIPLLLICFLASAAWLFVSINKKANK